MEASPLLIFVSKADEFDRTRIPTTGFSINLFSLFHQKCFSEYIHLMPCPPQKWSSKAVSNTCPALALAFFVCFDLTQAGS
ncbi:hypothetical protein V6N12_046313 [Hibiscus sabdariffa]|uniref:Uncharacterized protein n=1 Tax=Hibiscus sabdariffa TaxID=183260 RepID=A0ABR1ZRD0_9ROSI